MNFPFNYSVPYCWHLLQQTGIDSGKFELLANNIEKWLLANVAVGDWKYWTPSGTAPVISMHKRKVYNCILFSKEQDCLAFVLVFNMRPTLHGRFT